MVKRGIFLIFSNKKGLLHLKTIIYILFAIAIVILFVWAITQAAERIFG